MGNEGQAFRNRQSIPIVVNGVLYVGYPFKHVAPLEPETGKVLWEFTARGNNQATTELRSLAYWPADKQTPPQFFLAMDMTASSIRLTPRLANPIPDLAMRAL